MLGRTGLLANALRMSVAANLPPAPRAVHRVAKFRRNKPSALGAWGSLPAVDTGLFPRAAERRRTRDARRARFQRAKRVLGSARQARLNAWRVDRG